MQKSRLSARIAYLVLIAFSFTNTQAQSALMAAQSTQAEPQSDEDEEILVEGVRIGEGKPIVDVRNAISNPTAMRQLSERAEMFTRCAKRPDLKLVRTIIDGPPNTAPVKAALDRLIRSNAACYPTRAYSFEPAAPFYGECNPAPVGDFNVCQSLFYRGAILETAIRTYAPNLKLTRAQTSNRTVQSRFHRREVERNRFRVALDQQYFNAVSCMVQREPALATRLANAASGSAEQRMFQQAIIDRARGCVGNAKRVRVDPTQFRIYITDALYRWAVAAQNVSSLLPAKS